VVPPSTVTKLLINTSNISAQKYSEIYSLIITKDVEALKFHTITRGIDKRVTNERQASLLGILHIFGRLHEWSSL
jgi:hypothetical protein